MKCYTFVDLMLTASYLENELQRKKAREDRRQRTQSSAEFYLGMQRGGPPPPMRALRAAEVSEALKVLKDKGYLLQVIYGEHPDAYSFTPEAQQLYAARI